MPPANLHMTVLEVTHSQTPDVVERLVETMRPSLNSIADYTFTHRAKLVKPMLSFDGSACAVSFIPAGGPEPGVQDDKHDYSYTYQHLRRDLYNISRDAGAEIESRYTVP